MAEATILQNSPYANATNTYTNHNIMYTNKSHNDDNNDCAYVVVVDIQETTHSFRWHKDPTTSSSTSRSPHGSWSTFFLLLWAMILTGNHEPVSSLEYRSCKFPCAYNNIVYGCLSCRFNNIMILLVVVYFWLMILPAPLLTFFLVTNNNGFP